MLFVCRRTLRAFFTASDAAAAGSDPNQLIPAEPGDVGENGLVYLATDRNGAVRVTTDPHTVVAWSLCDALQIEICTVEVSREARGKLYRIA